MSITLYRQYMTDCLHLYSSSTMPNPAAAPEPSSAQGPDINRPRSSVSVNSIKTGYVRVSSPGAGVLYLSSAVTNVSGRLAIGTCSSRSQALVVQFPVGCVHEPCPMVIVVRDQLPSGMSFPARVHHTRLRTPRIISNLWLLLRTVPVPSEPGRSSKSLFSLLCVHRLISLTGGPPKRWALLMPANSQQPSYEAQSLVRTAVWSVCPVDNSIRAFWSAAGSELPDRQA